MQPEATRTKSIGEGARQPAKDQLQVCAIVGERLEEVVRLLVLEEGEVENSGHTWALTHGPSTANLLYKCCVS